MVWGSKAAKLAKNLTEILSDQFWFSKKRVMALMNMSAFMKVHVEAIMRNLALTCSQAWVFFTKSWMYSEDLNDFPQDV